MTKKVIYTAIFGNKDKLIEPKAIPGGFDLVCFTDQDFSSNIWDVRKVHREEGDSTRAARKRKVLAHTYLPEYEESIWIDGNIVVKKDPSPLFEEYLSEANMAIYDKNNNAWDPGDCVYDELDNLIKIGKRRGRYKDDPEIMKAQVERYEKEGYPRHNGMIISMIMLRRHNEPDVIEAMEKWWSEIKKGSKRDQLSFNYSVWKTGLRLAWLPGDSRDNEYFEHIYHPEHQLGFLRRVLRKIKSYATKS